MLENKTIAVVVPAYNEESQIGMVLETMPDFVDRIIVINDGSKDNTKQIIKNHIGKFNHASIPKPGKKIKSNLHNQAEIYRIQREEKEWEKFPPHEIFHAEKDEKIVLIDMKKKSGKGNAVAIGYKWAKENEIDCTAIMDGDGQMDPDELESICAPIVKEGIDYSKGNRLSHPESFRHIPFVRYFGNSVLSILTKIASGYWNISDTQTGYTAISKNALKTIDVTKIYPYYGVPNDILVKLNISRCTIREVNIKPVYRIGERSKMKIHKVIPKLSFLLLKLFFKRLWIKYFIKDFHPLFLLYHMGFVLFFASIPFAIRILNYMFGSHTHERPILNSIMFMFLFVSCFQSLLFAMWMDIQNNERLHK